MKLSDSIHFVSMFVYCTILLAAADDNSNTDFHDRAKREVTELSDLKSDSMEKRQREFIGKRMRDFVGKRSAISTDGDDDDEVLYPAEIFPGEIESEKRLREFVGKRNENEMLAEKRYRDFVGKREATEEEFAKRMRDFVGKRSDEGANDNMDKRMRDFVGKRFSADEPTEVYGDTGYPGDEQFTGYDKRMRDFVGKRSLDAGTLAALEKRFRDFVGKRGFPDDFFRITQRYFVRKPKYIRQMVGKRSYPSQLDTFNQDKRMRDFVGKRMRDFVGKRMRDFVGK